MGVLARRAWLEAEESFSYRAQAYYCGRGERFVHPEKEKLPEETDDEDAALSADLGEVQLLFEPPSVPISILYNMELIPTSILYKVELKVSRVVSVFENS